jgi:signal transduction histidine kinase
MFKQLAWIFVILTGLGLGIFGSLAYTLASSSLERELGLRLLTAAKLKARVFQGLDASLLLPGGREASHLRAKAALLAKDAGLEAVQILKTDGVVLIDTRDPLSSEGKRHEYLDLDMTEWEQARLGLPESTPLFKGKNGRLFKSAFAPVYDASGRRVNAVVRVEASANFLNDLRRFGLSLMVLGCLSLVFAVVLAIFVSRPIVGPVRALAAASQRVASGDFSARVEVQRADEIGQMSATFNEMAERLGQIVREKERLATLGELAAGVVHEIRNPLAAIEGFAELLERRLKGGDKSTRGHLRDIRNEVRMVNGFLSDFLEYAKPRQPRLDWIRPDGAIDSSLGVVLPGDKKKRWKARWEKREKVFVRADADQLRQVFVNLLMNAKEASPQGGLLFLGCQKKDKTVRLWVRDQGAGIPESDMPSLFTPFFSSKPMGTGLGLSIVQKIVESFGGQVEAESELGKGSCFTVILPIKQ